MALLLEAYAESTDSPNATSVGVGATIRGSRDGAAFGHNANVWNADGGIAVGAGSHAEAKYGIAVGVGSKVSRGDNNTAIGTKANVWGADSIAIGANAQNGKKGSVALGNNSVVTDDYQVSLGHSKGESYVDTYGKTITYKSDLNRKLTHVADGAIVNGSTEAVTGGQLAASGIIGGKTSGAVDDHGNQSSLSIALGQGSDAGTGYKNTVVGTNASTKGAAFATAIGNDASVYSGATRAVALGAGSAVQEGDMIWTVDGDKGVVSVGKSGKDGFTRRIVNVKAGVHDTDAVNVAQLNEVSNTVKAGYKLSIQQPDGSYATKEINPENNEVKVTSNNANLLANVQKDGQINVSLNDKLTGITSVNGLKIGNYDGAFVGLSTTGATDGKNVKIYNDGGVLADGDIKSSGDVQTLVAGTNAVRYSLNGVGQYTDDLKAAGIIAGTTKNDQNPGSYQIALGNGSVVNAEKGTALGSYAKVEKGASESVALGTGSVAGWGDVSKDGKLTDPRGVVSVGKSGQDGFTRRIVNVADGKNANDAVNKKQLDAVSKVANAGYTVSIDNPKGATQYTYTPGSTIKITGQNNNIQSSVDEKGIIHVNLNNDLNVNSVKANDISLTNNGVSRSFKDAGLLPGHAFGDEATVIGEKSTANAHGVALGYEAHTYKDWGTALGEWAQANAEGAVALGSGSIANEAHTVSVGSGKAGAPDATRRIVNVAAGIGGTDAVNVNQLNDSVNKATEGVVYWDNKKANTTINGVGLKGNGDLTATTATIAGLGFTNDANPYLGSNFYGPTLAANGSSLTFGGTGVALVGPAGANGYSNTLQIKPNDTTLTGNVTIVPQTNGNNTGNLELTTGKLLINKDGNEGGGLDATYFGSTGDFQSGYNRTTSKVSADENGVNLSYKFANSKDSTKDVTNTIAVNQNGVQLNGLNVSAKDATGLSKISNVAAGVAATDAVNRGQLDKVSADVTGLQGIVGDGNYTSTNYIAQGDTLTTAASKLDSQVKTNADEIDAFHTAGVIAGNTHDSQYALALGQGSDVTGDYGTAIGNQAVVNGFASLALGAHATVSGNNSVAIGFGSQATEDNVVSVGGYADGTQRRIVNVAAGVAKTDAATVGQVEQKISDATEGSVKWDKGTTDTINGVQVSGGKVTANNGISAGNGNFTVDKDGNVNIGNGNVSINASDGKITTKGDIYVNGDKKVATESYVDDKISDVNGQVTELSNKVTTNSKNIETNAQNIQKNASDITNINKTIGGTGENGALNLTNGKTTVEAGINKNTDDIKVNADNIANNKAEIEKNSERIGLLGGAVSKLDDRVDRVGAGAAALAALHPLDYDPANKWDFAAGYGNYEGASAVSIGTYYRPNENTMLSVGGSFGGGENMVNAGVSFKFGDGKSTTTTSRAAMAKTIDELQANNKSLQDTVTAQGKQLKDQDAKMKELEEKLQKLLDAQGVDKK